METAYYIYALALAVIGIWLFSGGITGMVISQSCCFPPNCPREYVCDAAEQPEPVSNAGEMLSGIMLLGASMTIAGFGLARRGNV